MSPTIFRKRNYRFFFFSREETRKHVHVVSPDGEAKIWIEPEIKLSKFVGYSPKHLNELVKIVKENKDEIIAKWVTYFGE